MSRYPRGQNGQHDRMLATQFLDAIVDERHRAHDKHGATSMEQAPLLGHKRASVLTEEAVECARALNDHEHHEIVLFDSITDMTSVNLGLGVNAPVVDELDKELIQTAAMAYAWWANRRGDRLTPPGPERGYFVSRDPQTEDAAEAIRGVLVERGVYPYLPAGLPVLDFLRELASAALRAGGTPFGTALHDAEVGEDVEVHVGSAAGCAECGRPRNAHSKTRTGGYLCGHPYAPADDPDGGRRGD